MKRSADFDPGRRHKTPRPDRAYTHGPLDQVFGQHAAFPAGDPSDPVFQYLASVRQEAEASGVFFARAGTAAQPPPGPLASATPALPDSATPALPDSEYVALLDSEYVALVVQQLVAEKAAVPQEEVLLVDFDVSEGLVDECATAAEECAAAAKGATAAEECAAECESEGELAFAIPQSAAAWRARVFAELPPPAAAFARLEHPTVIKLVVYFTRWLLPSMPPTAAAWLWRVFVRLDCGLDHTEMALVRELGLKARRFRHKAPAPEPIDRVLAVVGAYYRQRDLLLPEPRALSPEPQRAPSLPERRALSLPERRALSPKPQRAPS